MLHFKIISPTIAQISASKDELDALTKELSYRNLSAVYLYNKHLQKKWLQNKDPIYFEEEGERLKGEINKTLIFKKDSYTCTYPGIISYIISPHTVENLISYPNLRPMKWIEPPPYEPYFYQSASVEELLNIKHGHVSLPTGAGKSFILQLLAKNMGLKAVIVTPSKSIFHELMDLFEAAFGKSKIGGYGDGKKDIKKPITIAIGKSLTLLEEGSDAWNFFAEKESLMVDESHTWGADELSTTCNGALADVPYRLFVSATQVRNDGTEKLLRSIIGPCVFSMSIKEAMDQGFLCPLRFKIMKTISPSTRYISDPIECKREHFLRNPNIADLSARIANASWTAKQESTLILVEELGQIAMLKKLIKVPFTYVHSASKKEAAEYGLLAVNTQDEIERFNKGEVRVLIGTKSISTGVNFYPTHNTINWAGGNSEITTKQGAMGRSTRKLELSRYKSLHKPKPYSQIFDFDVTNQTMLGKQLNKRIAFYEETGVNVVY